MGGATGTGITGGATGLGVGVTSGEAVAGILGTAASTVEEACYFFLKQNSCLSIPSAFSSSFSREAGDILVNSPKAGLGAEQPQQSPAPLDGKSLGSGILLNIWLVKPV